MSQSPPAPAWLSVGLGLMLAAAITVLTFLAFEDIAIAQATSPAAVSATADQR